MLPYTRQSLCCLGLLPSVAVLDTCSMWRMLMATKCAVFVIRVIVAWCCTCEGLCTSCCDICCDCQQDHCSCAVMRVRAAGKVPACTGGCLCLASSHSCAPGSLCPKCPSGYCHACCILATVHCKIVSWLHATMHSSPAAEDQANFDWPRMAACRCTDWMIRMRAF